LIAKPTSLFSLSSEPAHTTPSTTIDTRANNTITTHQIGNTDNVTPTQRLIAIGVALLGVLGGSGAFTSIRWIGTRAHPLISVTYFSATGTLVSTAVLVLAPLLDVSQPELRFGLPHSPHQWLYLLLVCVCGFTTQFLLTAGLGAEKSNRATAMVYTHMLFAASFDKWVFGHEMGLVSLGGCGLIVGSALWVVLTKKSDAPRVGADDVEMAGVTGLEAAPMLRHGADDTAVEESDDEVEGGDNGRSR
jgi:drug/metabolite transporter (DMT)-like permease